MAVGALSALRDAGVAVPSAMTVTGFDDIPVATFLHPPLTSVRVGIAELGERAVALLLRAVSERAPPAREVLPTRLVVRGSCGPPTHAVPSASLPPGRRARRS